MLEELGRGAMGVVYRAHDPVIGREVAVKTIRLTEEGTGLTHAELIARFQTEAHAAGLLTHPNIVVVYDAGEDEGLFYMTMELVEGGSLQSLIDTRQSFPLPRVLRLMEQACAALQFAHERNVVHRDIKPANIMITRNDIVKITDFGTAKIMQFGTAITSGIIGTPSYMSPEQVQGKSVDCRSDIFSLGVIFYELVTGEKPFPGETITTVMYKIVNEDPIPPRRLNSSLHPGLNDVIMRALARDPAARYATCGELIGALNNYREQTSNAGMTALMPRGVTGMPIMTTTRSFRSNPAPLVPLGVSPLDLPPTRTVHSARELQPKKRTSFGLVLLLLGAIAGAGYRVWPYLNDVWQSRYETATPDQASSPQPAPPQSAATSSQPSELPAKKVTQGSQPPQAPPAELKPRVERTVTEAEPLAAEWKSRIEKGVADAGLADKVEVQVSRNALTLSGRLEPHEHRAVLELLRDVPPGVHGVDHIEDAAAEPGSAFKGDRNTGEGHPQPLPGRGKIEVATDVLGASAVLRGPGGAVVSECRTPCNFADLWPANYTLQVTHSGYRPTQRVLRVRPGSALNQTIELEALPTGLYVSSRPPQALVFVNGERQPDLTPTIIQLSPGTYKVAIRKPGFEPHVAQIQVKSDEQTQLDVDLAPLRGRFGEGTDPAGGDDITGGGNVFVNTTPPGADLRVDNVSAGQRTPARLQLAPGWHTLTISLSGFTVARRTILVEQNQPIQINVTLH